MHVVHKGRIVDLADLKEGSVFLADFDGGPIVRAVKAFYLNPSGIRAGKIVTVGPFREEDGGNPGVYEPHVIRQLAVIDLTGVLAFTFSTEPQHIGGFRNEAQRVKQSGSGRLCQAPRVAPGAG